MTVVKRYSNRKLYDTETKRYVTLEDLAGAIRHGEDVRVVDHVSGEDLTSLTLLQVIFEEEKKIGGLLPQVFLTRLIRTGENTVGSLRSRFAAFDPFQVVDEEIQRRLRALVESGRIDESEARRLQDLLLRRPSSSPEAVRILVQAEEPQPEGNRFAVLQETTPAVSVESAEEEVDPKEVEALLRQVETLEEELQRLTQAANPGPGPSA